MGSGEMTEDEVFLEFWLTLVTETEMAASSAESGTTTTPLSLLPLTTTNTSSSSCNRPGSSEWRRMRESSAHNRTTTYKDPDLQWNPLTLTYDIISEYFVQPILYISIGLGVLGFWE